MELKLPALGTLIVLCNLLVLQGNYGNPWQFGFYLPPATGFGDFCLGWDIALDSGIPIQSVLYTNAGVNGFWNNRHAINGASAAVGTPTLGQVLQSGNTTNGLDIVVSNGDDITMATAAQLVIANGAQGQVLGKTASGTDWITLPASSGTVTSVATGYRLSGGPITNTGTIAYVRSWADYVGGWSTAPDSYPTVNGTDPSGNTGEIFQLVGAWGTYYRFVPDSYIANDDAIYTTLTGSAVSGLITRRNS